MNFETQYWTKTITGHFCDLSFHTHSWAHTHWLRFSTGNRQLVLISFCLWREPVIGRRGQKSKCWRERQLISMWLTMKKRLVQSALFNTWVQTLKWPCLSMALEVKREKCKRQEQIQVLAQSHWECLVINETWSRETIAHTHKWRNKCYSEGME